MKRILTLLIVFNLSMVAFNLALPGIVQASIVPCRGGEECTVCDLQKLAANVVNTLIILGTMVATLLFVYAGILYVFSPANPGNIGKANGIFKSTLFGFVIILSAWLIVDIVMKSLYSGEMGKDWNAILCQ